MPNLTVIKDVLQLRMNYCKSTIEACITGKRKESNRYLSQMKDAYKGKRCFVIGTGPSLTKEDLELLKDEVTFASNRIFKMFTETDWRPTYYAIFDETVAGSGGVMDGINSFDCQMKFVREQGLFIYRNIKGHYCTIHSWHSKKNLVEPRFSTELTKGIYTIGTVTYALIEIAAYMGFSEIYLLGIDNKYSKTRLKNGEVVVDNSLKSYFGNESKVEQGPAHKTWEMDIGYQYAEEFSRNHGFRIYNATRGGYLEAFERVCLEDVLGQVE